MSIINKYFNNKKIKIGLLAVGIIFLLIISGFLYVEYEKYYPNTDDAYVNARVVQIATQVSGPVLKLGPGIDDHAYVKQGQLLFIIDPKPFQIAVDKAQAKLDAIMQQIAVEDAAIRTAKAKVVEAQAKLANVTAQTTRTLTLVKQKLEAQSEGDQAAADEEIAKASLVSTQSELQKAIQTRGALGNQNADLRQAKAALAKAQLDLSYTQVVAPSSGYLANFQLRVGDVVSQFQPLFTIIENQEWWVDANFKEDQLARIHPGESATITLDMYPGITFKGVVNSISAGSGASFSLLPPENATGNWVKVTQRFPVKIEITSQSVNHPLRIGASSTVTVDTRVTT